MNKQEIKSIVREKMLAVMESGTTINCNGVGIVENESTGLWESAGTSVCALVACAIGGPVVDGIDKAASINTGIDSATLNQIENGFMRLSSDFSVGYEVGEELRDEFEEKGLYSEKNYDIDPLN